MNFASSRASSIPFGLAECPTLKSSARAKGQLWYRPCHQSLTESLSEEHHRAEVAQEQTQVSNQEAQSRLLSKTSLYLSLSSLRIRFSGLRPLAGSLPTHAVPNHSVCSGAEPTNHIGSCQPAAAVKRRRVCAGLCKQTTARTGQIYPRTLTPRRARARNRVVICQQKVRSTESKKAELGATLRNHQKKRAVPKKQKNKSHKPVAER